MTASPRTRRTSRAAALFIVQRREPAAAARRRAAAAIEALVLAHLDLVEQQAHSVMAAVHAPHVDRRDLVGAGRLKMIELAPTYDATRGTFKAFVRAAVRGAMWELVRRRNWREANHLTIVPEVCDRPDERQSPEQLLVEGQRRELAGEAMEVLNDRERLVVGRYYDGEDLGAIGRDLRVSAGMASQIHRAALRKMQDYFALRGRKAA